MSVLTKRAPSTGASRLLAVACAVLAVLVVLLSWQNHRLEAIRSGGEQLSARPDLLAAGDVVDPFRVVGADESTHEIAFEQGIGWTVVLLFTMDCPACQANFHNWKTLEQRIGPKNVLYISVNPLEEARKYAQARRIEDRTVLFADEHQAREGFKIARIPQTILVQGNQVRAIQLGVLSPDMVEQFSQTWQDLKDQRPSS